MSDIARMHGVQVTEEMKRIYQKRLPEIEWMEKAFASVGLPDNKSSWSQQLYVLSSVVYAEAVEKNKICLEEGFGEKNDPRLDSFVDYLVANKVDKEIVENAIVEQIAISDPQPGYSKNPIQSLNLQRSAKRIWERLESGLTKELDDWHKCYADFRTANGLFLLGIDCMVRGEFVSGLEQLTQCYLLNKRICKMAPRTFNRYKVMNRRGFYINLCVQYCNDFLMTKFESGANRQNVLKEIKKVLVPALAILQEKAIGSPKGPEAKSLSEIKRKWKDVDPNCKEQWIAVIQEGLADNIEPDDSGLKLSKHRLNTFQTETGTLGLNQFYSGYMDIARNWRVSVGGMSVEEMSRYIQHNMNKISGLDFYKKIVAHEKNPKQINARMENIKKDGEQMRKEVKSFAAENGQVGYTLGRGRGKVRETCQNPGQPSPIVVVSGHRGRGRGVRNSQGLDEVRYILDTDNYTLDKEDAAKKNDKKKERSGMASLVSLEKGSMKENNSAEDINLSKKERKRRRKQIQKQKSLDEFVVKEEKSDGKDVKSETLHDGTVKLDEEDDLLDKLVNKFRSNLVVTGKDVDNKHFNEIAGGVIKRAANEFEKRMTEIMNLSSEKETIETNLTELKTELVERRDTVRVVFVEKSREMESVLLHLKTFEKEKDENMEEMRKINEHLKMLELKKEYLAENQNQIDSRIKDCLAEKKEIQTFLYMENKKANQHESELNNQIEALAINMREIDEKIENVKHLKMPEEAAPPKVNPNLMMIQFLETTIHSKEKQLECPVCFNVARAPIFSCAESHLVCGSCRPQLKLCPECRIPYKEKKRHRYAEMMAKEVDMLRQQKDKLEDV